MTRRQVPKNQGGPDEPRASNEPRAEASGGINEPRAQASGVANEPRPEGSGGFNEPRAEASGVVGARRTRSDLLPALGFLAPNLIGFLVFVAFPLIFSVSMAFTNWDLSLHNRYRDEPIQWIWLRNFEDLLTHPRFWKYFGNTLFMMGAIPLGIAGSLLLAVLLSRPLRSRRQSVRWTLGLASVLGFALLGLWLTASGYGTVSLVFCLLAGALLATGFTTGAVVYRTLFYLPHFTAGVAVYLLWKQMYNPKQGPVNEALQPILDRLADMVNAGPAWVWVGGGYLLWGVAAFGVLWLGAKVIAGWIGRDFGLGTGLVSLIALAAGGLTLYGLGLVLKDLPELAASGLEAPNWLGDVDWAKPAIMIMGLWMGIGGSNMLLYIAGISNIPQELYEAADIDGAGRWQRFWHVTWPQLAPTTFFIVVMSVIGGLQGGFEQARTMTGGGPYGATTTLSYFVYTEGFDTGQLGYASAVAWAMFAMIFVLTLLNYRFGSRYVND
jgi:multiple sugar transport system permease protein